MAYGHAILNLLVLDLSGSIKKLPHFVHHLLGINDFERP
jgi:hypothetical protein